MANQLPTSHFLPIDHSVHGAEADKPSVRAVTHLHGAKAPAKSDGYPEDGGAPGKSALYYYPNHQDAAMLWYHDHALGITRLNMYAGLFGAFVIRDEYEDGLNLPKGKYEIPLAIYYRSFDREGQALLSGVARTGIALGAGSFRRRDSGQRQDVSLSGGRAPQVSLSGSQRRQWTLLSPGAVEWTGIPPDRDRPGIAARPVPLKSLLIAPAERADLVIDFSGHGGEQIVVTNDAFTVMQFRVAKAPGAGPSSLPSSLRPVPGFRNQRRCRTAF